MVALGRGGLDGLGKDSTVVNATNAFLVHLEAPGFSAGRAA
jgi:hypothetical protein